MAGTIGALCSQNPAPATMIIAPEGGPFCAEEKQTDWWSFLPPKCSGSRTSVCVRITWRTCQNNSSGPTPRVSGAIGQGRACESAFPPSSQVLLLAWGPHSENRWCHMAALGPGHTRDSPGSAIHTLAAILIQVVWGVASAPHLLMLPTFSACAALGIPGSLAVRGQWPCT